MTDFLCTLKKEGPGYNLELSFDSIKSALDAALEILAFADADCYLERHSEEEPKTSPPAKCEGYMPFADLLRCYRKEHGYTQAELAKLLGTNQQSICSWESRGVRPHLRAEQVIREKLRKGAFVDD